MNKLYSKISFLLVLVSSIAEANDGPPQPFMPPLPPEAPIDGFDFYFLLILIPFGIYKIYSFQKQKTSI